MMRGMACSPAAAETGSASTPAIPSRTSKAARVTGGMAPSPPGSSLEDAGGLLQPQVFQRDFLRQAQAALHVTDLQYDRGCAPVDVDEAEILRPVGIADPARIGRQHRPYFGQA